MNITVGVDYVQMAVNDPIGDGGTNRERGLSFDELDLALKLDSESSAQFQQTSTKTLPTFNPEDFSLIEPSLRFRRSLFIDSVGTSSDIPELPESPLWNTRQDVSVAIDVVQEGDTFLSLAEQHYSLYNTTEPHTSYARQNEEIIRHLMRITGEVTPGDLLVWPAQDEIEEYKSVVGSMVAGSLELIGAIFKEIEKSFADAGIKSSLIKQTRQKIEKARKTVDLTLIPRIRFEVGVLGKIAAIYEYRQQVFESIEHYQRLGPKRHHAVKIAYSKHERDILAGQDYIVHRRLDQNPMARAYQALNATRRAEIYRVLDILNSNVLDGLLNPGEPVSARLWSEDANRNVNEMMRSAVSGEDRDKRFAGDPYREVFAFLQVSRHAFGQAKVEEFFNVNVNGGDEGRQLERIGGEGALEGMAQGMEQLGESLARVRSVNAIRDELDKLQKKKMFGQHDFKTVMIALAHLKSIPKEQRSFALDFRPQDQSQSPKQNFLNIDQSEFVDVERLMREFEKMSPDAFREFVGEVARLCSSVVITERDRIADQLSSEMDELEEMNKTAPAGFMTHILGKIDQIRFSLVLGNGAKNVPDEQIPKLVNEVREASQRLALRYQIQFRLAGYTAQKELQRKTFMNTEIIDDHVSRLQKMEASCLYGNLQDVSFKFNQLLEDPSTVEIERDGKWAEHRDFQLSLAIVVASGLVTAPASGLAIILTGARIGAMGLRLVRAASFISAEMGIKQSIGYENYWDSEQTLGQNLTNVTLHAAVGTASIYGLFGVLEVFGKACGTWFMRQVAKKDWMQLVTAEALDSMLKDGIINLGQKALTEQQMAQFMVRCQLNMLGKAARAGVLFAGEFAGMSGWEAISAPVATGDFRQYDDALVQVLSPEGAKHRFMFLLGLKLAGTMSHPMEHWLNIPLKPFIKDAVLKRLTVFHEQGQRGLKAFEEAVKTNDQKGMEKAIGEMKRALEQMQRLLQNNAQIPEIVRNPSAMAQLHLTALEIHLIEAHLAMLKKLDTVLGEKNSFGVKPNTKFGFYTYSAEKVDKLLVALKESDANIKIERDGGSSPKIHVRLEGLDIVLIPDIRTVNADYFRLVELETTLFSALAQHKLGNNHLRLWLIRHLSQEEAKQLTAILGREEVDFSALNAVFEPFGFFCEPSQDGQSIAVKQKPADPTPLPGDDRTVLALDLHEAGELAAKAALLKILDPDDPSSIPPPVSPLAALGASPEGLAVDPQRLPEHEGLFASPEKEKGSGLDKVQPPQPKSQPEPSQDLTPSTSTDLTPEPTPNLGIGQSPDRYLAGHGVKHRYFITPLHQELGLVPSRAYCDMNSLMVARTLEARGIQGVRVVKLQNNGGPLSQKYSVWSVDGRQAETFTLGFHYLVVATVEGREVVYDLGSTLSTNLTLQDFIRGSFFSDEKVREVGRWTTEGFYDKLMENRRTSKSSVSGLSHFPELAPLSKPSEGTPKGSGLDNGQVPHLASQPVQSQDLTPATAVLPEPEGRGGGVVKDDAPKIKIFKRTFGPESPAPSVAALRASAERAGQAEVFLQKAPADLDPAVRRVLINLQFVHQCGDLPMLYAKAVEIGLKILDRWSEEIAAERVQGAASGQTTDQTQLAVTKIIVEWTLLLADLIRKVQGFESQVSSRKDEILRRTAVIEKGKDQIPIAGEIAERRSLILDALERSGVAPNLSGGCYQNSKDVYEKLNDVGIPVARRQHIFAGGYNKARGTEHHNYNLYTDPKTGAVFIIDQSILQFFKPEARERLKDGARFVGTREELVAFFKEHEADVIERDDFLGTDGQLDAVAIVEDIYFKNLAFSYGDPPKTIREKQDSGKAKPVTGQGLTPEPRDVAAIERELKDYGESKKLRGLEGRIQRGLDPAGMLAVSETRKKVEQVATTLGATMEEVEKLTNELHVGGIWGNAERLAKGEDPAVKVWMVLGEVFNAGRAKEEGDMTPPEFLEDLQRLHQNLDDAVNDPQDYAARAYQNQIARAREKFTVEDGIALSDQDAFVEMATNGHRSGIIRDADGLLFVGAEELDYTVLEKMGLKAEEREDRGRKALFYVNARGEAVVKKLYPGFAIILNKDLEVAKALARTGEEKDQKIEEGQRVEESADEAPARREELTPKVSDLEADREYTIDEFCAHLNPGFDKFTQKSATFRDLIDRVKAQGTKVAVVREGANRYLPDKNIIELRIDPEEATILDELLSLTHEMRHVLQSFTEIPMQSEEAFVDFMVRLDAEAYLAAFQVANEMGKASGVGEHRRYPLPDGTRVTSDEILREYRRIESGEGKAKADAWLMEGVKKYGPHHGKGETVEQSYRTQWRQLFTPEASKATPKAPKPLAAETPKLTSYYGAQVQLGENFERLVEAASADAKTNHGTDSLVKKNPDDLHVTLIGHNEIAELGDKLFAVACNKDPSLGTLSKGKQREKKRELVKARVAQVLAESGVDFSKTQPTVTGLGKASGTEEETVYFTTVEWAEAQKIREKLGLPPKDFHITLASTKSEIDPKTGEPTGQPKDVHDVEKKPNVARFDNRAPTIGTAPQERFAESLVERARLVADELGQGELLHEAEKLLQRARGATDEEAKNLGADLQALGRKLGSAHKQATEARKARDGDLANVGKAIADAARLARLEEVGVLDAGDKEELARAIEDFSILREELSERIKAVDGKVEKSLEKGKPKKLIDSYTSLKGLLFELSRYSAKRNGTDASRALPQKAPLNVSYMGIRYREVTRGEQTIVVEEAVNRMGSEVQEDVPLVEGHIWEVTNYPRRNAGSTEQKRNQALKYQAAIDQGKVRGATIEIGGNVDPSFLVFLNQRAPDIEVLYSFTLPTGREIVFPIRRAANGETIRPIEPPADLTPEEVGIIKGIQRAIELGVLGQHLSNDILAKEDIESSPHAAALAKAIDQATGRVNPESIETLEAFREFERLVSQKRWATFAGLVDRPTTHRPFELFLKPVTEEEIDKEFEKVRQAFGNHPVTATRRQYTVTDEDAPRIREEFGKRLKTIADFESKRLANLDPGHDGARQAMGYNGPRHGYHLDPEHIFQDVVKALRPPPKLSEKQKKAGAGRWTGRRYDIAEQFPTASQIATEMRGGKHQEERVVLDIRFPAGAKQGDPEVAVTREIDITGESADPTARTEEAGKNRKALVGKIIDENFERFQEIYESVSSPDRLLLAAKDITASRQAGPLKKAIDSATGRVDPEKITDPQVKEEFDKFVAQQRASIPDRVKRSLLNSANQSQIQKAYADYKQAYDGMVAEMRDPANKDKQGTRAKYQPALDQAKGRLLVVYRRALGEETYNEFSIRILDERTDNLRKYIYVIDAGGTMRLFEEALEAGSERPSHSMLAGGRNVYAAGELFVRGRGTEKPVVTVINNGSGHYRPDAVENLDYAKNILERNGFDVSQAEEQHQRFPFVNLKDSPLEELWRGREGSPVPETRDAPSGIAALSVEAMAQRLEKTRAILEKDPGYHENPEYQTVMREAALLLRPPSGQRLLPLAEIDRLEEALASPSGWNREAVYGSEPYRGPGLYQAISLEQTSALADYLRLLRRQAGKEGKSFKVVEVGAGDGRLAGAIAEVVRNEGISVKAVDNGILEIPADSHVARMDGVEAARDADVIIVSWPPKGPNTEEAVDYRLARLVEEYPGKTLILLAVSDDTMSPIFRERVLGQKTDHRAESPPTITVRLQQFMPPGLNQVIGKNGQVYILGRSRRKPKGIGEGSYVLVLSSPQGPTLPHYGPGRLTDYSPPPVYRWRVKDALLEGVHTPPGPLGSSLDKGQTPQTASQPVQSRDPTTKVPPEHVARWLTPELARAYNLIPEEAVGKVDELERKLRTLGEGRQTAIVDKLTEQKVADVRRALRWDPYITTDDAVYIVVIDMELTHQAIALKSLGGEEKYLAVLKQISDGTLGKDDLRFATAWAMFAATIVTGELIPCINENSRLDVKLTGDHEVDIAVTVLVRKNEIRDRYRKLKSRPDYDRLREIFRIALTPNALFSKLTDIQFINELWESAGQKVRNEQAGLNEESLEFTEALREKVRVWIYNLCTTGIPKDPKTFFNAAEDAALKAQLDGVKKVAEVDPDWRPFWVGNLSKEMSTGGSKEGRYYVAVAPGRGVDVYRYLLNEVEREATVKQYSFTGKLSSHASDYGRRSDVMVVYWRREHARPVLLALARMVREHPDWVMDRIPFQTTSLADLSGSRIPGIAYATNRSEVLGKSFGHTVADLLVELQATISRWAERGEPITPEQKVEFYLNLTRRRGFEAVENPETETIRDLLYSEKKPVKPKTPPPPFVGTHSDLPKPGQRTGVPDPRAGGSSSKPPKSAGERDLKKVPKEELIRVLTKHRGNFEGAVAELGVDYAQLYRRLFYLASRARKGLPATDEVLTRLAVSFFKVGGGESTGTEPHLAKNQEVGTALNNLLSVFDDAVDHFNRVTDRATMIEIADELDSLIPRPRGTRGRRPNPPDEDAPGLKEWLKKMADRFHINHAHLARTLDLTSINENLDLLKEIGLSEPPFKGTWRLGLPGKKSPHPQAGGGSFSKKLDIPLGLDPVTENRPSQIQRRRKPHTSLSLLYNEALCNAIMIVESPGFNPETQFKMVTGEPLTKEETHTKPVDIKLVRAYVRAVIIAGEIAAKLKPDMVVENENEPGLRPDVFAGRQKLIDKLAQLKRQPHYHQLRAKLGLPPDESVPQRAEAASVSRPIQVIGPDGQVLSVHPQIEPEVSPSPLPPPVEGGGIKVSSALKGEGEGEVIPSPLVGEGEGEGGDNGVAKSVSGPGDGDAKKGKVISFAERKARKESKKRGDGMDEVRKLIAWWLEERFKAMGFYYLDDLIEASIDGDTDSTENEWTRQIHIWALDSVELEHHDFDKGSFDEICAKVAALKIELSKKFEAAKSGAAKSPKDINKAVEYEILKAQSHEVLEIYQIIESIKVKRGEKDQITIRLNGMVHLDEKPTEPLTAEEALPLYRLAHQFEALRDELVDLWSELDVVTGIPTAEALDPRLYSFMRLVHMEREAYKKSRPVKAEATPLMEARRRLALLERGIKKLEKEVADYEKAVKRDPNFEWVLTHKRKILEKNRAEKKALSKKLGAARFADVAREEARLTEQIPPVTRSDDLVILALWVKDTIDYLHAISPFYSGTKHIPIILKVLLDRVVGSDMAKQVTATLEVKTEVEPEGETTKIFMGDRVIWTLWGEWDGLSTSQLNCAALEEVFADLMHPTGYFIGHN